MALSMLCIFIVNTALFVFQYNKILKSLNSIASIKNKFLTYDANGNVMTMKKITVEHPKGENYETITKNDFIVISISFCSFGLQQRRLVGG
ncbi:MAG: hypothetical protein LUG95_01965 [Clostridiales bacterium]|nr:hypothetical protein [Clostridiales bacterium]